MWIYNFFNTFYNISPIFLERLKNMDFDKKRPSYYNMSKIYSPIALLSDCDYIIDNIYLGSSVNAADKDLLDKNNIGYILNITSVIPNFYESDLKYFNIKINDNGEESFSKEDLEKSYKFIIDLEKEDSDNNNNDNNDDSDNNNDNNSNDSDDSDNSDNSDNSDIIDDTDNNELTYELYEYSDDEN